MKLELISSVPPGSHLQCVLTVTRLPTKAVNWCSNQRVLDDESETSVWATMGGTNIYFVDAVFILQLTAKPLQIVVVRIPWHDWPRMRLSDSRRRQKQSINTSNDERYQDWLHGHHLGTLIHGKIALENGFSPSRSWSQKLDLRAVISYT